MLAFNRAAAERRCRSCRLLTPKAALIHICDADTETARKLNRLNFPLVVKPNGQGMSVRLHLVRLTNWLLPCRKRYGSIRM